MKISNSSIYPTAAVRVLLDFVAKTMEVRKMIGDVRMLNYSGTYRGHCKSSGNVLLRIGPPDKFAAPVRVHYRKKAPVYFIGDWKEALVMLAAHEFSHAQDFYKGRGVDEVSCEFAAYRTLLAFRAVREQLDEEIPLAVAQERVELQAREEKARAKKLALRHPLTKISRLGAKLAAWERKHKTAATYIKKYTKQMRRLQKQVSPDDLEPEPRDVGANRNDNR